MNIYSIRFSLLLSTLVLSVGCAPLQQALRQNQLYSQIQQQVYRDSSQYSQGPSAQNSYRQSTQTSGQPINDIAWKTFTFNELRFLKGPGSDNAKQIIATGAIVGIELGRFVDQDCFAGHQCTNEITSWEAPPNQFGSECRSYSQRVIFNNKLLKEINSRACRDRQEGYWKKGSN